MTQIIKPDLTLNMDEKIYLAVAKDTRNKTSFVFTLACLYRAETKDYNGIATREVHTFENNKNAAETFYTTVKRIVDINLADETKQFLFDFNEGLITRFYENTK